MDPVILVIVIGGLWGAFYLGSRKERKIFEKDITVAPEDMDMGEVSEEEYQKQLRSWKINDEETAG